MHIRAFGFLLSVGLATVGCTGSHPLPPDERLEGSASYQLAIDDVDSDSITPLDGLGELRLDLEIVDGVVDARVSPTWGGTFRYEGVLDGGPAVVVPVGEAAVLQAFSLEGWPVRIELQEIALDDLLTANAIAPAGPVDLVVRIDDPLGAGPATADARAAARPDDVAPQARIDRLTRAGDLLPWEAIGLSLSEPIAREAIETRLASNAAIDASYIETADGLVTYAELRPRGWWEPETVTLSLGAGYEDLTGNTGELLEIGFDRAIDAAASAEYTFDGGVADDVQVFAPRIDPLPTELACDGCVVLYRGPREFAGVYAELSSPDAFSEIVVRYRVLGERLPDGFGDFHDTRVRIAAAELGTIDAVESSEAYGDEGNGGELPEGFLSDSGFVEATVSLGREVHDAGLSLGATDGFGWYDTGIQSSAAVGASPPPPEAAATILVDSITVR